MTSDRKWYFWKKKWKKKPTPRSPTMFTMNSNPFVVILLIFVFFSMIIFPVVEMVNGNLVADFATTDPSLMDNQTDDHHQSAIILIERILIHRMDKRNTGGIIGNNNHQWFGRKRSNHQVINGGFLGKSLSINPGSNNNLLNNNTLWQHYLESNPANPNYWIPDKFHENSVCLLAAFSGIIHVKPANKTFRGGIFNVSPEESLGRRSNCERNSRNIFWKFSQHDERELIVDDHENDNEFYDDNGEDIDPDIDINEQDDDDLANEIDDDFGSDMEFSNSQEDRSQISDADDDDDDGDEFLDDNNNNNNRQRSTSTTTTTTSTTTSTTSTTTMSPQQKRFGRRRQQQSSSLIPAKKVIIERSNRLLSAGFHVVGPVIEFHVAYIECLQYAARDTIMRYQPRNSGSDICTNLSVSFDLDSFGNPQAYECNHIWSKTLKDVHYNQNKRHYAGEVQISLRYVRIDKDPLGLPPYSFRRTRRKCVWDTVLGWQSLTIMGSLAILFIIGFFGLCVCSNSSCHDENGEWSGCTWCCCCCTWPAALISARRRRRRRRRHSSISQRMVQYGSQTPDSSRSNLDCNHQGPGPGGTGTRRHRGPPPPPPPSSSTSLLTNASSHPNHVGCGHLKPAFSNSYSYEGTGSSNPTQQSSSSAMSTAIDDFYYYRRPSEIITIDDNDDEKINAKLPIGSEPIPIQKNCDDPPINHHLNDQDRVQMPCSTSKSENGYRVNQGDDDDHHYHHHHHHYYHHYYYHHYYHHHHIMFTVAGNENPDTSDTRRMSTAMAVGTPFTAISHFVQLVTWRVHQMVKQQLATAAIGLWMMMATITRNPPAPHQDPTTTAAALP